MNETNAEATTATVGVSEHPKTMGRNVMDVSGEMVVLTWVIFTITAFILYKIAWKPVLIALDKREETIKRSMDEAEKARAQAEQTKVQCAAMIEKAGEDSRQLLDHARKSAQEATESIQNEAQEQARILLDNAQREIEMEKQNAIALLRVESSNLAIEIAGRLVQKNMDTAANRALVEQLLKKF